MIKVESEMLVLDSTFTKQDVQAINEFVALAEKRVEERIVKQLEEMAKSTFPGDVWNINPFEYAISIIKEKQ